MALRSITQRFSPFWRNQPIKLVRQITSNSDTPPNSEIETQSDIIKACLEGKTYACMTADPDFYRRFHSAQFLRFIKDDISQPDRDCYKYLNHSVCFDKSIKTFSQKSDFLCTYDINYLFQYEVNLMKEYNQLIHNGHIITEKTPAEFKDIMMSLHRCLFRNYCGYNYQFTPNGDLIRCAIRYSVFDSDESYDKELLKKIEELLLNDTYPAFVSTDNLALYQPPTSTCVDIRDKPIEGASVYLERNHFPIAISQNEVTFYDGTSKEMWQVYEEYYLKRLLEIVVKLRYVQNYSLDVSDLVFKIHSNTAQVVSQVMVSPNKPENFDADMTNAYNYRKILLEMYLRIHQSYQLNQRFSINLRWPIINLSGNIVVRYPCSDLASYEKQPTDEDFQNCIDYLQKQLENVIKERQNPEPN